MRITDEIKRGKKTHLITMQKLLIKKIGFSYYKKNESIFLIKSRYLFLCKLEI